MTVITIIGILVGLYLLFLFITSVNNYTYRVYKYDIFNKENYFTSVGAYALIFFGNNLYRDAVANSGDILNGQLLIGFGIMILVGVFAYNIKHTSLILGFILSLIQVVIYVPAAIVSLLILLVLIAYFSETKPVYNIN